MFLSIYLAFIPEMEILDVAIIMCFSMISLVFFLTAVYNLIIVFYEFTRN